VRFLATSVLLMAVYLPLSGGRRQIDLSADHRFTLSPESQALARSVGQPLKIIVFLNTQGPAARDARFLLARYHDINHLITTMVVDPDADPATARRYGVSRYSTVVLTSGTRRVDAPDAEELELSTAILRLERNLEPTVCLLTGHGEDDVTDTSPTGLEKFNKLLEQNAYRVRPLDLSHSDTVPSDCSVVALDGPRDPLLPGESAALRSYVAGAGRLFVLASALSTTDPNPITEPLGIHFVGGVAVDPDHSLGADPSDLVVEGVGSANPVDNGVGRLHFPVSGALALAPNPGAGLTTDALAVTGGHSYLAIQPDVTLADQPADPHGSLTVVAAGDRSRVEDTPDPRVPGGTSSTIIRARAFVTSGDAWATNAFLDDLGNRRLAVNALAWLTEQEQLVAATSHPSADRPLPFTAARQRQVIAVTVVAVPGAIVGIGSIPLALRRRRRR
jgi:hypothetical protein